MKHLFRTAVPLLIACGLSACTTTPSTDEAENITMAFEFPKGHTIPKAPGLWFSIPGTAFPSAQITRHLRPDYCVISFSTELGGIDEASDAQAYASVLFQARESDSSLELLFLVDKETRQVQPLIAHSDDEGLAEPIGTALPETASVYTMIFPAEDGIGILINNKEDQKRELEIPIVTTGFEVGAMTFSSQGAAVDYKNIRFLEKCAETTP